MDKKDNYWEVGAKYQMLRQVTVQGKTGSFILNKDEKVELVGKSKRVLKCKVAKSHGRAFSIGTDVAIRAFKKLSAEEEAKSLTAKDEYLLPAAITLYVPVQPGQKDDSEESDKPSEKGDKVHVRPLLIPAGELVKRGKPSKGSVTYTWGKASFKLPVNGQQDLLIRGELKRGLNFKGGLTILIALVALGVILTAIVTSGGNFMTILQVAVVGFFLTLPVLAIWRLVRNRSTRSSEFEEE